VAFGLWPLLRRKWLRAAALLYPAVTLFCIVVTGNHFWLDGVGGLIVLGLGFVIGQQMHSWNQRRLDDKFEKLKSGHPSAGAL
jgi:membrane-associated phospholipid phosphatase